MHTYVCIHLCSHVHMDLHIRRHNLKYAKYVKPGKVAHCRQAQILAQLFLRLKQRQHLTCTNGTCFKRLHHQCVRPSTLAHATYRQSHWILRTAPALPQAATTARVPAGPAHTTPHHTSQLQPEFLQAHPIQTHPTPVHCVALLVWQSA